MSTQVRSGKIHIVRPQSFGAIVSLTLSVVVDLEGKERGEDGCEDGDSSRLALHFEHGGEAPSDHLENEQTLNELPHF